MHPVIPLVLLERRRFAELFPEEELPVDHLEGCLKIGPDLGEFVEVSRGSSPPPGPPALALVDAEDRCDLARRTRAL
jgi:hypothetical protein